MRYLGPYGSVILELRDKGLTPAEIVDWLKEKFPDDGLWGLQPSNVKEFVSASDASKAMKKKLGDTSKENPPDQFIPAESVKLITKEILRHPQRKMMEWIVFLEFQRSADIAIEKELGWEPGDLAEFRGDHEELYTACKADHVNKVKEFYSLDVFKTHQLLASLCEPALREAKALLEAPDTPKTVKRSLIKDILDITVSRAAVKRGEDVELVELGEEFKAAHKAAKKAYRRRIKKIEDKAGEMEN